MLDNRLTDAARRGDTPAVLEMIEECPQQYRAEELYLALLWASSHNHTSTMRALITAGADVNAAFYRGHRILSAAAKEGSVDAVRMLLETGADATAEDPWGKTALDYAKRYKHPAVVALLEGRVSRRSESNDEGEG